MDEAHLPLRQRLEIPNPTQEIIAFEEAIVGQDEAVSPFARLLVSLRSGIRPINPQPLDVKFLAGPSGVGKTEIVYRLAELLGGLSARNKVIKLNGAEYKSKAEVARLIGAPPGYIGSEDSRFPGGTKPLLSQESLNSHRISFKDRNGQERDVVVILLDEAEKADPSVGQAFLSILDKGNLDLANNTSADFSNAVIFFTSNVGNQQAENIRGEAKELGVDEGIPEAFKNAVGDALVGTEARGAVTEAFKQAFPPELRGRIKDLIIFKNLSENAISKIVDIKMHGIEEEFRVNGIHIKLEVADSAKQWLTRNGYNPSEGARALEKLMQTNIKEPLILAHGGVGLNNKTIYLEQDEATGELAFYFSETADLPPEVPALSEDARQQLIDAILSKDIGLEAQITKFIEERDRLLQNGTIPSAEAVKKDPEIQSLVNLNLVRRLREQELQKFIEMFNFFAKAGLVYWSEMPDVPELRIVAQEQMILAVREKKPIDLQFVHLLYLNGSITYSQHRELQNKFLEDERNPNQQK